VVALDGDAPREVFANFISHQNLRALSAPWHPDGNRISIWGWDPGNTATLRSFWTVSLAGGVAVRSEVAPEILRQLEEVSAGHRFESGWDVKFSWAPSGKAAKNLWKMTVDPRTLQATAIERLTTGPVLDTQLAVSADGRKLSFYPGYVDAYHGRTFRRHLGAGQCGPLADASRLKRKKARPKPGLSSG
jgi:hypothetical protein